MSREKPKDKYCDFNSFKRASYFHGMLMSDRDFREEQIYHIEKRKMLNRTLHGCGVVCGLKITPKNTKSSVITIDKGLALDCHGNEIFVCEPYDLDVDECIKACMLSQKKLTEEEICEERGEAPKKENKWYVVIKYQEVPTDPVPVYAPGGGCEEKVCEHSRVREGYCIELLREKDLCDYCKPPPYNLRNAEGKCKDLANTDNDTIKEEIRKEEIRKYLCEDLVMPCPGDCCDDPCVVLGSITFDQNTKPNIEIESEMINNWDSRRYVMTFGLLEYWMTELAPLEVKFENIVDYVDLGVECSNKEDLAGVFKRMCEANEADGRQGSNVFGKVETTRAKSAAPGKKKEEKKPGEKKK